MEQPIPDWLDKDFLAQCLQNIKDNQNIEVINFDAALAVPAGHNYGACVVRVKVDYKESKDDPHLQTISLIVKSELTEGPLKDSSNDTQFKEPMFYQMFLPEARKLTNIVFAPKNFFSPKSLVTIMEDLKDQGFLMADKLKMLDFDHCRLYMEAAASFHAVSFAIHKANPGLIESLGEEKESALTIKTLLKNINIYGFRRFSELTAGMERYKKYSKPLLDISENLFDLVKEAEKPSSGLKTLTQGDPWTTNMMFKYDDTGVVKEVKLLDFQALRYASPVNDLVVFISAGANHDVRRNRINELYKIYIDTFNLKLQELNCSERLTMENILDGVQRLRPVILQFVGASLPFILSPEPVDAKAFLQQDNETNPFDKYYNEGYCTNHLPKLLEYLELTGVLDYLENYKK